MQVAPTLIRTGETRLPQVFVPAPEPRGRPRIEYRLRVACEKDIEVARRYDLPVHALTAEQVTNMGYPIDFPTRVVAARSFLPILETPLGTIPFVSEDAARSPRPGDVIVAMLRFDSIGARAIYDRNSERMDATYLLSRILEENAVRRANFVRFFDVLPSLPRVGEALGRAELERKLRKNPAGTGAR